MRYAYRCCLRCRPRLRRCRPHGWKAPACGPRNTHRGTPAPHPRRRARRQGPQEGCAGGGPHGPAPHFARPAGLLRFPAPHRPVRRYFPFRTLFLSAVRRSLRPARGPAPADYPARAEKRRSPICRWPDGRRPPVRPKPPGKGLPPGAAQGCVR